MTLIDTTPVLDEEATFIVCTNFMVPATGSSVISILNGAASNFRIRIHGLWLKNSQQVAITGPVFEFEARRFSDVVSAHSGGSDLTSSIVAMETTDTLDPAVTVRSLATTITTESTVMDRWLWGGDEMGFGAGLDTEAYEHGIQNAFPLLSFRSRLKPLTLRPNQGFHVKQAATVAGGHFDITLLFTQVAL